MLKFEDLYESYAADIYRFALWLSGDSLEAEDIASETLIRAWVRNNSIRTETLKAYLFAIARNLYLERQRKRKRQVPLDDIYADPAPRPERVVESRLEIRMVQDLLQALPEIDRAAFVLRVQHELPYAEIARVLALSLTTAKVKVHRVRRKLLATRVEREES